jgi:hypothetical protein
MKGFYSFKKKKKKMAIALTTSSASARRLAKSTSALNMPRRSFPFVPFLDNDNL